MIYLFYGEDEARSLNKVRELVEYSLSKKKSETAKFSVFNVTEENFDELNFKNFFAAGHLFGGKSLIILRKVLENDSVKQFILNNVSILRASSNIFVFLEKEMDGETLLIFKSAAEKILEFKKLNEDRALKWINEKARALNFAISSVSARELLNNCAYDLKAAETKLSQMSLGYKEGEKKAFKINIFNLTDAVSEKSCMKAWIILQKMLLNGIDEEEIFWKIFWQVKNLILVSEHKDKTPDFIAENLKMHNFTAVKCLNYLKNYSCLELQKMLSELTEIYREFRYAKINLGLGLEKFILNL